MIITEEQRRSAKRGEAVRIEDTATGAAYVLIAADRFERLRSALSGDASEAYPAVDEAFREGWDAPGIDDYDEYETHRP